MTYVVTMEGGLRGGAGSETELHHVKEALALFYEFLHDRGHSMSTAFINGQPINVQIPEERDKVTVGAKAHYEEAAKDPIVTKEGKPAKAPATT